MILIGTDQEHIASPICVAGKHKVYQSTGFMARADWAGTSKALKGISDGKVQLLKDSKRFSRQKAGRKGLRARLVLKIWDSREWKSSSVEVGKPA